MTKTVTDQAAEVLAKAKAPAPAPAPAQPNATLGFSDPNVTPADVPDSVLKAGETWNRYMGAYPATEWEVRQSGRHVIPKSAWLRFNRQQRERALKFIYAGKMRVWPEVDTIKLSTFKTLSESNQSVVLDDADKGIIIILPDTVAAPAAAPRSPTPVAAPAPALAAPAPAKPSAVLVGPPVPEQVDPLLTTILCWKRPFESKPEIEFMGWLKQQVEQLGASTRIAARGNLVATVKREDGTTPSTLFSCHTDTVHHGSVAVPQQKIVYDANFGHISLDKTDKDAGSCLGADDGIGVWIMLGMIEAKVPGTYVFHRGEEKGCVGSNALLKEEGTWLASFDVAVAFDRPRCDEIITHQGGQRCASEEMGKALADALNALGPFNYAPSNRGVFTDTRVYRYVIAECLNIGVGYERQHGADEFQDYGHAVALRDACIKLNWEALPVKRDPKAAEKADATIHNRTAWGFDGGLGDWEGGWHGTSGVPVKKKRGRVAPAPTPAPAQAPLFGQSPERPIEDEFRDMDVSAVRNWMRSDLQSAAVTMVEMAAEMAALRAHIKFLKGTLQ